MNKTFLLIFFLAFFKSVFSQNSEMDAKILEKSFEQMMGLQSIAYESYKEAEESNVTYLTQKDFIYFDLNSGSILKTPRYYIENNESKLLYDGKIQLLSSEKKKLIMVNDKPIVNNPLLLTFVPIRNFLAEVLTNNSITVKLIGDKSSSSDDFEFKITIHNGWFDWERRKIIQKDGYEDSNYVLHLYADNLLPKRITKENGPTGHLTRTFDNYKFNQVKSEDFWEGKDFPDYKRVSLEEFFQTPDEKDAVRGKNSQQEPVGQDFELPLMDSNDVIKSFDLKGEVVLLEFWFRNCGPCIKAIPSINMLHKNYANKGLKVFGVEFKENENSLTSLKAYKSKIEMNYPSFYNGNTLAKSLKVTAAPTIVIMDKKGNIIYNEMGYDEEKVKAVLSDKLNQD